MLDVSHNYWLVAASLAIALMAGFTGLSLLHGASNLSEGVRKRTVALAAIILGGGIWSMHFVAMLGMTLPIDYYYDPLTTLISALIAILVVGIALLLLHFKERTSVTKSAAGTIIGVGILVMHYTGMSGIQRCLPLYSWPGIIEAVLASIGLSIAAVWIAYGDRSRRNIILGTIGFGLAVFAVHFVAMSGTDFIAIDIVDSVGPFIDNNTLAFVVTLGSFIICGAFCLNSITFGGELASPNGVAIPSGDLSVSPAPAVKKAEVLDPSREQIPYERNGTTFFLSHDDIAAIRAEGHYTVIYTREEKLFCPWSLSQAEKRLPDNSLVKTHRSYLVNPKHVSGFERKKDNGVCLFDGEGPLEKVPVSRSRLPAIREALGLT